MAPSPPFAWPDGIRAAISLSFDDARPSQLVHGVPLLDRHGVRATFYVSPPNLERRVDEWARAAANGHEIGNHTLTHPCSGNFAFSRSNALEDYTLPRMEQELLGANQRIEQLLGLRPTTFAYPCGQTYVGRGEAVQSYVPLVARHFVVGRGAFSEAHNDPTACDLAQIYSPGFDRSSWEDVRPFVEKAVAEGGWLVLVGHNIIPQGDGPTQHQTVPTEMLDSLCAYARRSDSGLWIDTVAAIGQYVAEQRELAA